MKKPKTGLEVALGCGAASVALVGVAVFYGFWAWVIVHIVHALDRAVK